jgi:hypothetical protein
MEGPQHRSAIAVILTEASDARANLILITPLGVVRARELVAPRQLGNEGGGRLAPRTLLSVLPATAAFAGRDAVACVSRRIGFASN